MENCPKKFLYEEAMFPNHIFVIKKSSGKSFWCSFNPENIKDKLFGTKISPLKASLLLKTFKILWYPKSVQEQCCGIYCQKDKPEL